jgi:hypothetical protein
MHGPWAFGDVEGYDQDSDIEHWRKPKESPDEEVHRWITFALAVIVAQKQREGAHGEEQPNPAAQLSTM